MGPRWAGRVEGAAGPSRRFCIPVGAGMVVAPGVLCAWLRARGAQRAPPAPPGSSAGCGRERVTLGGELMRFEREAEMELMEMELGRWRRDEAGGGSTQRKTLHPALLSGGGQPGDSPEAALWGPLRRGRHSPSPPARAGGPWVGVPTPQGPSAWHRRVQPRAEGLQNGFHQPHVPQAPAHPSVSPVLHQGPPPARPSLPLPPLCAAFLPHPLRSPPALLFLPPAPPAPCC